MGALKIMEVQRLTRCVADLSRFISRSTEQCPSFFKTLKKLKDVQWTEECQKAFKNIEAYLYTPPL